MAVGDIRFVKELYPRLKPSDDVVERYRLALENLPPVSIARDGVLVDGYHRWQAHVREDAKTINVENLGNLSDAEIVRESIRRNAAHGQQLSQADKRRLASSLWTAHLAGLAVADRVKEVAELLSVSERIVHEWTKDARAAEKQAMQEKAWDLWLNCLTEREIAERLGEDQPTINRLLIQKRESADLNQPPESRQHFDVWSFATTDREGGGQQSYFGALPPQVMENLLWFFTEPGETVVDLFAGSGTTVDVGKKMGRRVWASDIRGNKYSPHLPIHQHDAVTGWPTEAPGKANLIFLDPPYWRQAKGRYSREQGEMAEMQLDAFLAAWSDVARACMKHVSERGRIAFIVSPADVKGEDEQRGVVDLALLMLQPFEKAGWKPIRRIIVPYSTQQATGDQVNKARAGRWMLKLYRDLVVLEA